MPAVAAADRPPTLHDGGEVRVGDVGDDHADGVGAAADQLAGRPVGHEPHGGDGVAEDVRYHRAIAEAARNPFLIATLEYLGQFLQGATRVTRANEALHSDFVRQVRNEHAAVLLAIEVRDEDSARRTAGAHMNNAIGRIDRADPAFWAQAGVLHAQPLVSGMVGRD